MEAYDVKRHRKDLCAPTSRGSSVVEVPPLDLLVVDGHGDPNTSTACREAVEALTAARNERLPALDLLRFERCAEGRSAQVLHVGPHDDEGPVFERLRRDLPANGLTPTGRHHEVHLSDARRTDPARLRTILRRPVRP